MAVPAKSEKLSITIPPSVREITFTFGHPNRPDRQVAALLRDQKLQQDPLYKKLLQAMTTTAAEMLNNNLLSGFDITNTPYEVEDAIRALGQVTNAIYNREVGKDRNEQQGLRSAFALYRAARLQVFNQEQQIKDLPAGSQEVLITHLRWHIEHALQNPLQFTRNN